MSTSFTKTFFYSLLEDVPRVATTAYYWSAHNKSYIGRTLHWIDPKTRSRKLAELACWRITGSHTFDVLAQAMTDIHSKFKIRDKVRRTTTDKAPIL